MSFEKLKLDKPYPELASELVRRLKSQNETLWKRWVEIESSKQGINDIWNDVLRHVRSNVEALTNQEITKLIMEMRGIAHREANRG
jgi:hypothetical protein